MTGNPKTLKDQVAALTAQVESIAKHQEVPDPILAEKGQFFGTVLANAVGTAGSRAFSDQFLQRLENNAERIWNAYVSLVRGDSIMMAEERVKQVKAAKAEVEAELARARATLNAQAEVIRDLTTMDEPEDELPEEASEEAAEAAATEAEKPQD
jgi:hypothetical protein